jgi:cation transport ATPase
MDCAAEEQMVRDALEEIAAIRRLEVDLAQRRLTVYHEGAAGPVAASLGRLRLGSKLVSSEASAGDVPPAGASEERLERRTLIALLAINAAMFIAEQVAGWIASSAGLLADSPGHAGRRARVRHRAIRGWPG